jgi:hypothetical protein
MILYGIDLNRDLGAIYDLFEFHGMRPPSEREGPHPARGDAPIGEATDAG